jgi:hypothetical protein
MTATAFSEPEPDRLPNERIGRPWTGDPAGCIPGGHAAVPSLPLSSSLAEATTRGPARRVVVAVDAVDSVSHLVACTKAAVNSRSINRSRPPLHAIVTLWRMGLSLVMR